MDPRLIMDNLNTELTTNPDLLALRQRQIEKNRTRAESITLTLAIADEVVDIIGRLGTSKDSNIERFIYKLSMLQVLPAVILGTPIRNASPELPGKTAAAVALLAQRLRDSMAAKDNVDVDRTLSDIALAAHYAYGYARTL